MDYSNVYVVRFTVEVTADSREDAVNKACEVLDNAPETAEVYDVERLWILPPLG